MSRLTETLTALRAQGRKGLIIYLTAGYPSLDATKEAALAAYAAGADVVEIGLPFSDPMADGPVIQQAASLALKGGTTTAGVLSLVADIRRAAPQPLVLMTYVNPVLQYGAAAFARDARQAGADGLIVPDLPLEESGLLAVPCRQEGLDLVPFVAPTTTADRLASICRDAAGFIYCVSRTGVTGAHAVDYRTLRPLIEAVRRQTDIPVAIGFGIASPAAARQAAQEADAVIVGSAVMEQVLAQGPAVVPKVVALLRKALDEGR